MKKILRACKLSFYKLLFTIKCFGKNKKKIFLFHVPVNSNMGDQAIIYAEKKFVKKYFPNCKWIEISYYLEDRAFEFIINKIKSRDLILIQGGGSLGDLYPKEEQRTQRIVKTFTKNKIIIMPQTITYRKSKESDKLKKASSDVFSKHPHLVICAREKISYNIMCDLFPKNKILLIPDIVLSLNYSKKFKRRRQILFLLRNDFEKQIQECQIKEIIKKAEKENISYCMYDTFLDDYLLLKKTYGFLRKRRLFKLLKKCAKSQLIVTDRLHGMVFSFLTYTPCYVFENINHKIRGVYAWIENANAIKLVSKAEEVNLEILDQNFIWPDKEELDKQFQKLVREMEKNMQ